MLSQLISNKHISVANTINALEALLHIAKDRLTADQKSKIKKDIMYLKKTYRTGKKSSSRKI